MFEAYTTQHIYVIVIINIKWKKINMIYHSFATVNLIFIWSICYLYSNVRFNYNSQYIETINTRKKNVISLRYIEVIHIMNA